MKKKGREGTSRDAAIAISFFSALGAGVRRGLRRQRPAFGTSTKIARNNYREVCDGTFFDGRPAGDWKVITTPKALSPPNVFAQLREKGAEHHYNVVLIEDTNTTDLDLSGLSCPSLARRIWAKDCADRRE